MSTPLLTTTEVQKHNSREDCWIIIRGVVYNVTDFLDQHPGGSRLLLKYAGKDATHEYEPIHPANALEALPSNAKVGALDPDSVSTALSPAAPKTQKKTESSKPSLASCLSLNDLEAAAEKILTPRAFAYFKGAADDEWTAEQNQSIFRYIRFRPRVLIDISEVDTSTMILGQKVALPFMISPAAMAKQAHPDGELALCRAASKYNIAQGLCTNASYGFEDVAKVATPEQTLFYQVYVHRDRSVTERTLRRVKQLGYKAIILTVDAVVVGKRERDEKVNIISEEMEGGHASTPLVGLQGLARSTSTYFDIKLTWQDIAWIRSIVGDDLSIALKGVQTAEDAAMCANWGCAIWVSNHGGRQLNGAPTSIEILLEMRKHCPWVFDKVEVIVDGGYRRGTDILKAIALGARAVALGRSFLFSLAYGQEGAEKAIEILAGEISTAMRLLGVTSLSQLGPQYINAAELEKLVSPHYDGPPAGGLRAKM